MLTALRDGAKSGVTKFILFGFLVMAVGGLVLTDVGGFFRDGGVGTNDVARAGKEKVGMIEFDSIVRRQLPQTGMTAREAYDFGMIEEFLRIEVGQRLMAQSALAMGIYPGDDIIANQIATLIEPLALAQPGIPRREITRRMLQNYGMSEGEFVAAIRRSLMNAVMQTTLHSAALPPTRAEAVALHLYRGESRVVKALVLTNDSVDTIEPAHEDTLRAFYEVAKETHYAIPETRRFSIAVLEEKHIKDTLDITDDMIKREYERNITAYTTPERRAVHQAVLDDHAQADAVLAALNDGSAKNLKEAVKAATGSETAYLGERTHDRRGLPESIGDAAFTAETGTPIGPLRTALGWHVMVVAKIIPSEQKSFAAVKDDLRADMIESRLANALYAAANSLDDRLASGEELEAVAKDMGMTIRALGPVLKDGSTPDKREAMKDFEQDREHILQSVFDLYAGETAPVLELQDGRYALVRVDDITPRSYMPFEDAKTEIAAMWLKDQKASANRQRANDIRRTLAAGEITLADAARTHGGRVETITLKRGEDAPEKIGQIAHNVLFDSSVGDPVLAETPHGYMVGMVETITLPDPAKVSDDALKSIIDSIARSRRDELMLSYMQTLERDMGVRINRHTLGRMYGPESGLGQ